jgi:hypothetical protein
VKGARVARGPKTAACNILCWNVRGLNEVVRQDAVSLLVKDTTSSIVCLEETKLQNVDAAVVRRMVGAKFTGNFIVLPAAQTVMNDVYNMK